MTRPNEGDAFIFAALGELGVLAQKTVAGVNGLCACGFGCGDDFVSHEVGLARGCWTNQHGFIGQLNMARFFVGFRINGHGLDAHFLGGGDDAAGDFATVGNQNFLEHRESFYLSSRA